MFQDFADYYVPTAWEALSEDDKDKIAEGFKVDFSDFYAKVTNHPDAKAYIAQFANQKQ